MGAELLTDAVVTGLRRTVWVTVCVPECTELANEAGTCKGMLDDGCWF